MHKPSRGEIWEVDLDPTIGHEQGFKRPAVVVSVDDLNHGPSELVTVVPITGTKRDIPLHTPIKKGIGGLTKDSWALCDQLRTISRKRLIKPYGNLNRNLMQEIEENLRIVLGL